MLPSCIPLSTPFYHHPCGLPNATTAMLPPTVPTPATSLPDCVSSIRAASSKESRQRNLKALHPVHSSSIQFSHSPMPHFPCQPTWAPPLQDSSTLWTNRRLHQPSTQRCPTCFPHTPLYHQMLNAALLPLTYHEPALRRTIPCEDTLIMKTWTHEQSLWKEDAYEQSRGDYTQEERNEQRTVSTVPVRMESINISPY